MTQTTGLPRMWVLVGVICLWTSIPVPEASGYCDYSCQQEDRRQEDRRRDALEESRRAAERERIYWEQYWESKKQQSDNAHEYDRKEMEKRGGSISTCESMSMRNICSQMGGEPCASLRLQCGW